MTPLHRVGSALAIAVALSLVTACTAPAPTPSPTPTIDDSAANTPPPTPAESVAPAGGSDPTCETIIPAATVEDFESLGWSAEQDDFRVGATIIDGGLQCVWADHAGPATDHVQIFGWAPIEQDAAYDAQDNLVGEGWVREDQPDGVYITENPETTISTDENGYGMTYLFGDGWVKVADTKQGLLLVVWGD
ncbi:MAG TPA: hypothetical protein VNT50_12270 [Microbacterium sp.]|uniref:hypothetical protein n=1 Tax=Microbacterium sp. TaxID=51671 RepID=UPI002C3C15FF|nr:hypothetical protein [Microbacterium sp.]HWI32256.1 hypothetical protein [Microbacterium sp.]